MERGLPLTGATIPWMTPLCLLVTVAVASDDLGTIEGAREAPDWTWSLALRGGAAVPVGGTGAAWGPGPELGLSAERRTRPGLGVWLEAQGSSHRLSDPSRLVEHAAMSGTEQLGALRVGLRWGAEGHPVLTPTFGLGLGAVWVHTRLEAPTATGRSTLVQDIAWPSPRAEFALAIRIAEPLALRPSLGGSCFVGMDVGERTGDAAFAVWRAEGALDLVVRLP